MFLVPIASNYLNLSFIIFWFVVVAPSLTTRPTNITIDEDDEATFECIATGNPTPKITWINKIGKTVGTRETLSFKANRTDSGKYLCVADNGFKTTVNASAYLNVLCKSDHIITINFRKLSLLADFETRYFRGAKCYFWWFYGNAVCFIGECPNQDFFSCSSLCYSDVKTSLEH